MGTKQDLGLQFKTFDAYFIYSFLLDVRLPAPLHVLMWEAKKAQHNISWDIGCSSNMGVHPTMIPLSEETPIKVDDSLIKEDDEQSRYRMLGFSINCESVLNNGFELCSKEKDKALVEVLGGNGQKVKASGSPMLRLDCSIRLFPSGLGTCTFHLGITPSSSQLILASYITETVQRLPRWEYKGKKTGSTYSLSFGEYSPITLWNLYLTTIRGFREFLCEITLESGPSFLAHSSISPWRKEFRDNPEKLITGIHGVLKAGLKQEEDKETIAPNASPAMLYRNSRLHQREKVEALLGQFGDATQKARWAFFESRFPMSLDWCDSDVSSHGEGKVDGQIPFFVGAGILSQIQDTSEPFAFMEQARTAEAKHDRKHVQALELALRAFALQAWDVKPMHLFPQELGMNQDVYPLRNRGWNKYTWVCLTKRTGLLFVNEQDLAEEVVEDLFNIFKQALLDLSQLIRCRWHGLVILNWLLDQVVVSIKPIGLSDTYTIERIVNLRRLYSLYLNSPMTYKFEGGSFTEMAQEAREMFWIRALERTLEAKFHQVDRMYEEHLHAQALEHLSMDMG